MSTDSKPTAPKAPKPKDIEIEVVNPRSEGATIEMVVKAMLRRPRKDDKGVPKPAATANTKRGLDEM